MIEGLESFWKSRPRHGEARFVKGIRAATTVPLSEERTFTLPPNCLMRSSMPIKPTPETILPSRIRFEAMPRPLSEISASTPKVVLVNWILALLLPECR